jgi:hypothetical protein
MVVTNYFDFDAQTPSLCKRQFQFNACWAKVCKVMLENKHFRKQHPLETSHMK